MTEKYKLIDVSYDFQGNHIKNFAVESRDAPPTNPVIGEIYHDTVHDTVVWYNGMRWVPLPYLGNNYKVPMELLSIMDSTGDIQEASDETIPTTLLMKDELAKVIPTDVVVTEWSDPVSDSNIPSEKLTKDTIDDVQSELDGKIDGNFNTLNNKIDGVEQTLNGAITSLDERMVEGLAGKVDDTQIIGDWGDLNPDEDQVPKATIVADTLDAKVNKSQITAVITQSNEQVPSGQAVSVALNSKTDITMAIHPWKSGLIYNMDSTVIADQKIYISLVDANTGHDPLDDTEHQYWTEISGSGGGGTSIRGKTILFGNTTDTEYTIVHNLSTYDFIWSLRTTDSPREYVTARIQAVNRSSAKVILTRPPGPNALTINLVAMKSSVVPTTVIIQEITEPALIWPYANTTGNPLFVQTYDTEGQQIYGDVSQSSLTDFDPTQVEFTTPNNGTMILVSSQYVYRFDDTDVWIISHGLDRLVAIQCFTDDEGQVTGDLIQNGSSAVASFSGKKSGYAVAVVPNLTIEMANETVWTVQHNLNRIVAVQTFDTTGDQIFGSISQDGNTVSVTFTSAKSGYILII